MLPVRVVAGTVRQGGGRVDRHGGPVVVSQGGGRVARQGGGRGRRSGWWQGSPLRVEAGDPSHDGILGYNLTLRQGT